MKNMWRKMSRRELLSDFIAFVLLICIAGSYMILLIAKTSVKPVTATWFSRLPEISVAVIFVLILLSGISLYRLFASHIRWYKELLDAIPTPVIVTDKNAVWLQANKAARDVMNLERDSELGELNSKHLINPNGSIMEKTVTQNGATYHVSGRCLNEGYIIFLNRRELSDSYRTRTELIDEINKLFDRLSTASDQFHDCASNLAGCTIWQAGVIHDLSDVIAGIASGELKEPDVLNEKMDAFKSSMQQHEKSSKENLEAVKRAVKEIAATRDCIGDAFHDIGDGS